jgi:drug/metabolite transporter (DMT)-like permease
MAFRGELAALGTAFCWSLTAVFFNYSGRRVGSDVVNRMRVVFAVLLLGTMHWLLQGSVFPFDAEPWRWGWLTLSSVLGLAVGDGALFYAYTLIGPRIAMLLMTLVPVFSSLLAWLFFDETIAPLEMAGIAITVAAVGWVISERATAQRAAPSRQQYGLGLGMALVGALGQTSNLVVTKFALIDGYSALSATLIRVVVALVFLWLWAGWQGNVRSGLRKLSDRRALLAIAGGAFVGPFLGIWLSLIAVQATRVGIASTIMALPPVILIPFSALLFKEHVSWRALVGTGFAIGGVALLFL